MQNEIKTPDQYIDNLPEDRKEVLQKLRTVIKNNLPKGFEEIINYKMIGYVVPHTIYPNGYHCDTKLPLPFINLASQKNFIAIYHMGIYASPELMDWFVGEYPKYVKTKLDMGKSCIRFKKIDQIPIELIGQLASKLTVKEWVNLYESKLQKK